ncbi:MAG: PqqD family protein [Rhodobacteraceae bacterium]|jgi:hypothetical protein|nr:PqqD family protein [Paracoccaceae bacterium]
MNRPTRFQSAPDCVSCPYGEGVAILDLRSNVYFSLNAVGAEVWSQLDRPVARSDLVAHVSGRFAVTPEVCAPDIDGLLDALAGHGLIEPA